MKIGKFNTSKKIFIIAEIGNNHEGNFELAKKLIKQAALAGADAVKFQTFIPEHISSGDKNRLKKLNNFKLSYEQFEKLAKYSKSKKIIFFSTPFDIESAKFLNNIQPVFKIASGDNNFYPLINKVASFGKPMIISTGGADLNLIKKVYKKIKKSWSAKKLSSKLAFLHCVSAYPVPFEEANLASIRYLKNIFPNIEIGYSDHTLGINAALYSVFVGARIIEKHFTLDKNFSKFRDHKLSADPKDLKLLVHQVRKAESMYGIEKKMIQKCERGINIYGRRSVAAAHNLKAGIKLSLSDFIWVRPGKGYAPGTEKKLVGRKTTRDLQFAQVINKKDFM